MGATVTLRIDGAAAEAKHVTGWKVEGYVLDGAPRCAETAPAKISLEAEAVLELELATGTRLLVAAEDAHRYLGTAARDGGEADVISVGQTLRFSGPRLPAGTSRDGLGAWILKSLRIFREGPAGMTALIAAGAFQDAQLEQRNGLYQLATDRWQLTRTEQMAESAEPTLLFLHGTGSSTSGSFGGLWENSEYRRPLVESYQSRIYGFEHRSLTESPIANALALIKTLPDKARLHLVSHSRGGMVGELLARANRSDQEPFSESDIERFRQYAKRSGREGFEKEAERLRELNREMRRRTIRVERFVRVACPARGTTLASGKLDRWASVMLNLFGAGLDLGGKALPLLAPVAAGYDLLQHFLLAVVRERTDGRVLPGLEAMMPDSPLVALLNGADVHVDSPLHILAGDFQGDSLLSWIGDCLSEIYYGGETDLVVNTPSMSGGAIRTQGIRRKALLGPEVHHLSYFRRDESALALLDALQGNDSGFELLTGPSRMEISRGGREVKRNDNAPIVFLLPGIMGSHIQKNNNRIWFEPFSMCSGGMEELSVEATEVSADGWLDHCYEKLARHLADTHEVRPFAYDWRLSITKAAALFGEQLDQAMLDAKQRGKPLRIVAHSMGGLVARLALKNRWRRFKALPGSRLLQLGTPNKGSHSIAAVLTARDDFVQTIERWCDWKNDMRHILAIVSAFPGVLELLPWPEENGFASDGLDYFAAATWQNLYEQDGEDKKKTSWIAPGEGPLTTARKAVETLRQAGLDPDCSFYVAGHAPTPVAVQVEKGEVKIGWIDEGDGRVPWSTGIPAGVPVWYTEAAHGDLASHEPAFEAYRELLEKGDTRLLSRSPAGARSTRSAPVFLARSLAASGLYPSAGEVLAAAVGGSRPAIRVKGNGDIPATMEIIHGSLAGAEAPILIGSYAGDSIRDSAGFLDDHLDGALQRAYTIGRYPRLPDDAMVFLQIDPSRKPAGAIVVGLGPVGELLPGTLTQALTHGLLEYARIREQQAAAGRERLQVSSLLVGTGFSGLTVETGVRCLLESLQQANTTLKQAKMKTRIGRLTIFEEVESKAISGVQILRDLLGESRYARVATFDGRLHDGQGGYCGRCFSIGGQPGAYRVQIAAKGGALNFTVVTDRARNVVSAEPSQRQAVDGLIRSATGTTRDQPGLSRALFELLVPNGMKGMVTDLKTLMLSVDAEAAAYPWELMRDNDRISEPPLAARVELIRQLASTYGRGRVQTVNNRHVFIVGDTQSGLVELPGAQAEAKDVAECFARAGYEVNDHYKATAMEVFEALFNDRYQFMHLAGHGVAEDGKSGLIGMVLGPKTYLTTAQAGKLRHVPEFVFINCCHLGSMAADAKPRWGELAANLATQFIELGCKAVIAAGWAVDDQAASTFARTFYETMFKGRRFAEAVLRARTETHRLHPATNTWGAFQAYGDDRYCFIQDGEKDTRQEDYVHPSHLLADLSMLSARLKGATKKDKKEYYRKKIAAIEEAARGAEFQTGAVMEALAAAWAELNERERAIGHYRAALGFEDAGLRLRSLEQLANLEIREGARLLESDRKNAREKGEKYMDAGLTRLGQLIDIGPTVERLSLRGSYWKRRLQVFAAAGAVDRYPECLSRMESDYWRAAEQSHQRSGSWDYYPLLNALDSAFLCRAWGDQTAFARHAAQLPDLLAAAADNGRRRFAEDRQLYHGLAEIEAERVGALWNCYIGERSGEAITDTRVQQHLIAAYRDLLNRLGSSCEPDSATKQLQFISALLPEDEMGGQVKKALQLLIAGIIRKDGTG